MKKILFLLTIPIFAFGFSETELDSLESSGSKTFSKSPWRIDMGLSLLRNLDVETRERKLYLNDSLFEDKKTKKFCNPSEEGNLCDLSNLYYNLDLTAYYSLANWAKKYFNHSFLKGTELFLGTYFSSDFKGGACSNLENYNNLRGYITCNLGDLVGGWTTLIYKKQDFFTYFNFSTIIWPLSKKSKDSSLTTNLKGSLSTLYFIKKENEWSGAISSNHSLNYNHFTSYKSNSQAYNKPLGTSQQLSFILKQEINKYLPANTRLFINYSFILNTENTHWHLKEISLKDNTVSDITEESLEKLINFLDKEKCPKSDLGSLISCGSHYHELALGLSSSWKLQQRMYLNFTAKWQDLIKIYSPRNKHPDLFTEPVGLKTPPGFRLENLYFTLRASYSF